MRTIDINALVDARDECLNTALSLSNDRLTSSTEQALLWKQKANAYQKEIDAAVAAPDIDHESLVSRVLLDAAEIVRKEPIHYHGALTDALDKMWGNPHHWLPPMFRLEEDARKRIALTGVYFIDGPESLGLRHARWIRDASQKEVLTAYLDAAYNTKREAA